MNSTTWQRYLERHYADVMNTIKDMGYQCDEEKQESAKLVERPPRQGGYIQTKLSEPITSSEQKQRDENSRANRAKQSMKIRLTDLDDMCWQYGLTLPELLLVLVPVCLPLVGGWRRKAQQLARRAMRKQSIPPKLGFPLTRLVSAICWKQARQLAVEHGRRVSHEDTLQWAQEQRMAATILRLRGKPVSSPMDNPPGDLDTYIRSTDDARRKLNAVMRRGIMPYRILPMRKP